MKIILAILILRDVLIACVHTEAGSVLEVGQDIDVDTAGRLVREGCAVDADEAKQERQLSDLTVAQLKDLAAIHVIDLGTARTKAEIIAVLEAAKAANEADDD